MQKEDWELKNFMMEDFSVFLWILILINRCANQLRAKNVL